MLACDAPGAGRERSRAWSPGRTVLLGLHSQLAFIIALAGSRLWKGPDAC